MGSKNSLITIIAFNLLDKRMACLFSIEFWTVLRLSLITFTWPIIGAPWPLIGVPVLNGACDIFYIFELLL